MDTGVDALVLTPHGSSFVTTSAAIFGFSPTRPEWFRYQFETNAEQLRGSLEFRDPRASMDAQVGFWTGWLDIGLVPDDEARDMAVALRRAYDWYKAHPNEVPDWFDPYPKWDWRVIRSMICESEYVEFLPTVFGFIERGAFVNTVEEEPEWFVILTRSASEDAGTDHLGVYDSLLRMCVRDDTAPLGSG
jgi:hypothetical protein